MQFGRHEKGIVIGGHFMGFDGTGPRGLSYTVSAA